MDTLQAIRTVYGQPMKVTSAYRCPEYNARLKGGPEHPKGMAVDIEVGNPDAMELIVIALAHGVRRIGVAQKAGKPRFLHIGGSKELPVAIWSY